MKYCTKCGSSLDDGVKFCTVCGQPVNAVEEPAGAPVTETPVKEKKTRKKLPTRVLALVLAVAVLAGGAAYAVSSGMFASAPEQFVKLQEESYVEPAVEAFSNYVAAALSGEAADELSEAAGINTDVTITVEQDIDEVIQEDYLDDSALTLQINTEADEKLFGFELNLMGSDVLSGILVFAEDYIGIQLPELDDEYYTVDFDDLADILVNVAGADEETVNQLIDALTGNTDGIDVEPEQIESIVSKYVDIVFGMVNKDNVEKSKDELKLEGIGKTVKGCTVLTFTPDGDDIEEMICALAEALIDDDDLRDLVEEVCDSFGDTLEFTIDDYDEMLDYIEENYEEAAEYAGEEVEDAELLWSVAYKGDRIYEVKFMSEEYEGGISYESYGSITDGRIDALVLTDEGDAEVILQNDVKLKGKTVIGELEGNEDYIDGEISVSYSIDATKKSGLCIPYGSIEGTISDVDFELTVEADGKKGSLHELVLEIGKNEVTVSAVSTDEKSEVSLPKGSGEALTASNIMDVIEGMATEAYSILSEILGY